MNTHTHSIRSSSVMIYTVLLIGLSIGFCPQGFCQPTPTPIPAAAVLLSPTLLSPAKDSIVRFPGTGELIYFSWSPVENAKEYLINVVVGTMPKASTRTPDTSIYLDLGLKSTDIGATVSWSVTSASGTVLSKASIAKFTFGVDGTPQPTPIPSMTPTPLPPPVLYYPENNGSLSTLDQLVVPFDWSDVTGASAYRLTVYRDNEEYLNRVVSESDSIEQFHQQIFTVLQWDVKTIDAFGNAGYPGVRYSFSIGKDVLPTPTPLPLSGDIDANGKIDILDLYQFARRYATNDPKTDLDRSGIATQTDLLKFLELFVERSR